MTNTEKFLEMIITLEVLGVPASESALPLSEIYLVNLDDFKEYSVALQDCEYRKLTTLNNVLALSKWQAAYGTVIFGSTDVERQTLEAKEKAFRKLSQICGEEITVEALLRHRDNNYAITVLGLIYYFGLGREQNQKLGEEYLNCAAKNKDCDAMVWRLWKYPDPEMAEEIISSMSVMPEYIANPASLQIFKNHYKVTRKLDVGCWAVPNIGF